MKSQYLELAFRFTRQVYYYCYLLRHERIMRGIFTDFFILLLPTSITPNGGKRRRRATRSRDPLSSYYF